MGVHLKIYRVGTKIKLNVYEDERPLCQCHNEADAQLIVEGLKALQSIFIDHQPSPSKIVKVLSK